MVFTCSAITQPEVNRFGLNLGTLITLFAASPDRFWAWSAQKRERESERNFFMAAVCNRAGHIYFHPVVSSSFFFFPRLISAVGDWIGLPYFHTWCGLSANLECISETCCARLAENTGHKKIAKKLPSGHHPTTLSGYIFATKACIDNQKRTC